MHGLLFATHIRGSKFEAKVTPRHAQVTIQLMGVDAADANNSYSPRAVQLILLRISGENPAERPEIAHRQ